MRGGVSLGVQMPKHPHDPDLLAAIGRRLQQARVARGLSQAELAERIAIEPVTLSRYETGARGPSITTLRDAARVLGITLADLVADERPLPQPAQDPRIQRALHLLGGLDAHHLDLAVRILEAIPPR